MSLHKGGIDPRDLACDVVIIGGGPAGVTLARTLPGHVVLLEKRAHLGGRVKSAADDNGVFSHETGAWRVPKSHKDILAMAAFTVTPGIFPKERDQDGTCDKHYLLPSMPPPTEPGYCEPRVSGPMHTLPSGLSTLWQNTGGAKVYNGVQVIDVEYDKELGWWRCYTSYRVELLSKVVVLAHPPWHFRYPGVRHLINPLMSVVHPMELAHTYMKVTGPHGPTTARDDGLGSLYPHKERSEAFNLHSYTVGTRARTLSYLYQTLSPRQFCTQLEKWLKARGWPQSLTVTSAVVHHNDKAYAQWTGAMKGSSPQQTTKRLTSLCEEPNPAQAPGLFVATSAISGWQGWMQGAYDSAQSVGGKILKFLRGEQPTFRPPGKDQVIVYGRRVNVKEFRHPGGPNVFKDYLGTTKDIGPLFERIHGNSTHPNQMMLLLSDGFYKE